MSFYKDFLPSSQSELIEKSINRNIEYFKYRANGISEKSTYDPNWESYIPNWESYISRQHLNLLLDDPNPKSKEKRLICINEERTHNYPRFSWTRLLKEFFPGYKLEQSGCFYYPVGGFMGWHTNHDRTEDRLYITYTEEDKKSFFRYYEDGNIITDYDNKGITIRRFSISGELPYFWHCVGSYTNRFSFGYRLRPIQ